MINDNNPSMADDERGEMGAAEPADDVLDALLAADVAAWRATLPAEEQFAARMEGVLRSVDLMKRTPSTALATAVTAAEDEHEVQDGIELVREPLHEPRSARWATPRRLSSRRGLLAVGAMAAVVAVLIVVIQVAQLHQGYESTSPSQTVSERPPTTMLGGAWQQIALPVSSAKGADYAISPSDPATIYACFNEGVPPVTSPQVTPGAISLWVTHDAGRHWSTIGPPLPIGASCQITLARGDPARVGVLVEGGGNADQACDNATIYLSDDGGARWRAVPYLPVSSNSMLNPQCQLTVTRDTVYVLTYWLTGEPVSGGVQVSAWQRTTDDGQTWQRLDTPFGAQTLFMPWEIGTGDSFLASVLQAPSNVPGMLWITHNGGTNWQPLGPLPLGVGTFVLPSPASGLSAASASQPFYALAGEQIPSFLLRHSAYESGDGRTWSQLPPLPVSGATSLRTGMTDVLGVDQAGRLYSFGVDPARKMPTQSAEQQNLYQSKQWLWIWDPRAARWEQFPTPLDAPWPQLCDAVCWQGTITAGPAGANYLWVDVLGGDNFVTPALYRVLVR